MNIHNNDPWELCTEETSHIISSGVDPCISMDTHTGTREHIAMDIYNQNRNWTGPEAGSRKPEARGQKPEAGAGGRSQKPDQKRKKKRKSFKDLSSANLLKLNFSNFTHNAYLVIIG